MNAGPASDERLRPLRQLLERGDLYQDLSARMALLGGLLSLIMAGVMLRWQAGGTDRNVDARIFFDLWALVFLATLLVSISLLLQAAQRRGDVFFSPGMKLALSAVAPSFLAGAAISACLTLTSGLPLFPVLFWVLCYGLGLLATRSFAPPAVGLLGWAFVLTGIGAFIYLLNESLMPEFDLPTPTNLYPTAIMGVCFGGYHLIYAVGVLWSGARRGS